MSLLDDFIKLNKTSRYTISAALIIIALLGAYNWVISPHTRYLSAAQQYEQVLNDRAKTNKIILNNLKTKNINLEELNAQLENLKEIAFTEKEAKQFWTNLKTIIEDADCYFDSISIFEETRLEENTAFSTESAALNITGSYNGITQVIKRITSHPDKTWIDSLQLRTMQNSSILQCDMTITIYKINKERFSNAK
jgi:Tfp pilus assembly protein PilO